MLVVLGLLGVAAGPGVKTAEERGPSWGEDRGWAPSTPRGMVRGRWPVGEAPGRTPGTSPPPHVKGPRGRVCGSPKAAWGGA